MELGLGVENNVGWGSGWGGGILTARGELAVRIYSSLLVIYCAILSGIGRLSGCGNPYIRVGENVILQFDFVSLRVSTYKY